MNVTVPLAALAAASVAAGTAVGLERERFRYERQVSARGEGAIVIEPDGPMFAHTRSFADLRVVDARGRQVPWRRLPRRLVEPRAVRVLNSGRRGRRAVALVDLGPRGRVYDRAALRIPARDFVGRVVVHGADARAGPYARLSATGIYDVGGARHARSTTALFPPTDHRYLRLEATGVPRIAGVTVSGAAERPRLVRREFRRSVVQEGRRTRVTLDLGHRGVPVHELRIAAATPAYERAVTVEGSSARNGPFGLLAEARIFRFEGSRAGPIAVGSPYRFLRITIENGDDPPLEGIRIEAWSESQAIVLEPGYPRPLTMLYGGRGVRAPSYEFARLPFDRDAPTTVGVLGPERLNEAFEPAPDTRSFTERHGWVVEAALALAALVVAAAGLVALRGRA